jgi:hypothetical protein
MHWRSFTALLAVTLVVFSACGGDDGDSATPAPTATAASTPAAGTPTPIFGENTATPGPPTGTPGPEIDSSLFPVIDSISYNAEAGLYFVGEVQNNSDRNAIIVVRLSLKDSAGTEIGSGEDRLQSQPYTAPGETFPFKMLIAGTGGEWTQEDFTVTAREATEGEIAHVYDDFEITGSGVVQAELGVTVQGIIRNTGTVDMSAIKIMFIARDIDRRIIGAWGANPPALAAGAETVFGFPVLDVPAPPANYDIWAYGYIP